MKTMLKISACPICGSKKISRVKRTLVREYRGKRYEVPDLEFYECSACGERFFDRQASQRIDRFSPALRSRTRRQPA
jgi:YgiT-type zinc finger domain-containing protein